MAKLDVVIIKTRPINSFFSYACRLIIGGKMQMSIKEEEANEFIKKFDLLGEPAVPTNLRLNKKRFFDIKYT